MSEGSMRAASRTPRLALTVQVDPTRYASTRYVVFFVPSSAGIDPAVTVAANALQVSKRIVQRL